MSKKPGFDPGRDIRFLEELYHRSPSVRRFLGGNGSNNSTNPFDRGSPQVIGSSLQTTPGSTAPSGRTMSSTQSTQSSNKQSGVGYGAGKYGTKIKTPKSKGKHKSKSKKGLIIKRELGGIARDVQCVYLGHCICVEDLTVLFWANILKLLFAKQQRPIRDLDTLLWQSPGRDGWRVTIQHRQAVNPNQNIEYNFTLTVGSSIYSNAVAMRDSARISFTDTLNEERWENITLYAKETGAADYSLVTTIFADSIFVQYGNESKMAIQNTTVNTDGSGNSDGVYNQPIKGYLYGNEKARLSTGFYTDPRPNNGAYEAVNGVRFWGDNLGVIAVMAATQAQRQDLFKPLEPWEFHGNIRGRKVNCNPSAQVNDMIRYKSGVMSLITLLKKHSHPLVKSSLGAAGTQMEINMGRAHMYAFEKRVDFVRTPIVIRKVEVGYELNHTTWMTMTVKNRQTSRIKKLISETAQDFGNKTTLP